MRKVIFILIISIVCCALMLVAADEKQQPKDEKKVEVKKVEKKEAPKKRLTAPAPHVKKWGGFYACYIDFNGPYTLLGDKLKVVYAEVKKQGVPTTGPYFMTFYNPPSKFKGDELKWAPSFPIAKETEVKPPLKKRYVEPVTSVIMVHRDKDVTIWDTFNKVQDLIKEKKYVKAWPAYEMYHKDPYGVEVVHPIEDK